MIVRRTAMHRKIRSHLKRFAAAITIMAGACTVEAGSATWNLTPVNNRWNKAANWTPATVPYGERNVATFETSNVTNVMLGVTPNGDAGNILGSIVFESGASAYTITMSPVLGQTSYLAFYGAGITNNSGITQNVIASKSAISDSAQIYFLDSASAGENVVITNEGATHGGVSGASTRFWNSSTAANATIVNEGSTASGTLAGGFTSLLDYSTAESATVINNGGTVSNAAAAYTLIQTFPPGGNLGTSTFIANPATVPGAEGGWVEMDVGTCSGTSFIANGATVADCQAGQIYAYGAEYGTGLGVASFTANGGNGTNAQGGLIDVFNLPLSDQTVVIANAGTNDGFGGTLSLTGANTYTSATTVSAGTLIASNRSGSATGTGSVNVNAGMLGGKGIIQGAVTLGTGSGAGAFLAPSVGSNQPARLTLKNTLTFKADSAYTYRLNTNNARADQVISKGVAIESGAEFDFQPVANRRLTIGTVFTAISNTSINPIAGTFSNLPDGSTFTAGRNNFQVSYSGGDGNDLTLTVVP